MFHEFRVERDTGRIMPESTAPPKPRPAERPLRAPAVAVH